MSFFAIIIDTNIYSAAMHGTPEVVDRLRHAETIGYDEFTPVARY